METAFELLALCTCLLTLAAVKLVRDFLLALAERSERLH